MSITRANGHLLPYEDSDCLHCKATNSLAKREDLEAMVRRVVREELKRSKEQVTRPRGGHY